MLDWKKREGSARESVKETRTEPRGYFKSILLSRSIATLVGVYVLVCLGLGWYWSQEPDLFPVQQNAQQAAEREGKQMVPGFTTVETLKNRGGHVAQQAGRLPVQ